MRRRQLLRWFAVLPVVGTLVHSREGEATVVESASEATARKYGVSVSIMRSQRLERLNIAIDLGVVRIHAPTFLEQYEKYKASGGKSDIATLACEVEYGEIV